MFYQNFDRPDRIFAASLSRSPFKSAITVHPIKEPSYMLNLHHHFLTSDFLSLEHRAAILNHRLRVTRNTLEDLKSSRNKTRSVQKPYFYGLLRRNSTVHWEYCTSDHLYGLSEPPMSWVSGPILEGVRKLKSGVMSNINMEARRLLKPHEDFKKLHSATLRTHPTMGTQLTMSLETLLKTLFTTKPRFPQRMQRILHFQQSFGPLWKRTLGTNTHVCTSKNNKCTIYFIVPLAGRLDTFLRFLNSFEKAFVSFGLPVCLLIVYFPDVYSPVEHKKIFAQFRAKHPKVEISWVELLGEFSRARALDLGVRRYRNDSLLFFADVDLIFETEFYYRCQAGAIFGKRVYFPLMFSQFNPQVVYYNRSVQADQASSTVTPPWESKLFTRRAGIWRKYSFGPVCVYSNDVIAVGGLNTTIRGWGLEDLDFYEKCLRHKLEVLRAPDLGLVHVYHSQTSCLDPRMNSEQAKMCEDSRRRGIGSEESLVDYMLAKGYV